MFATVTIDKSFDETRKFSKELEDGDFEEFFQEEGEYLDRLVKIAIEHGHSGDEFTVVYTVNVKFDEDE